MLGVQMLFYFLYKCKLTLDQDCEIINIGAVLRSFNHPCIVYIIYSVHYFIRVHNLGMLYNTNNSPF